MSDVLNADGTPVLDVVEICRLYTEERYTLRMIADEFETNHHMIKRILTRQNIEISPEDRVRKPFSDEHRRKIGAASSMRSGWNKGMQMDEDAKRKNMLGKIDEDIDLDKYQDYERLLFLSRLYTKRREQFQAANINRETFLDAFYFDRQFNIIYDAWVDSCQNKWYRPTLDHKESQSNGGDWKLDNLQFLTWFENRAKAEMNEQDWIQFQFITNTSSDLFIRADHD